MLIGKHSDRKRQTGFLFSPHPSPSSGRVHWLCGFSAKSSRSLDTHRFSFYAARNRVRISWEAKQATPRCSRNGGEIWRRSFCYVFNL